MGKIGDIFVRLGLKSDGFETGVKKAEGKLQGFGSKLKGFKTGALAIWAAVGAGALKLANEFAHHSQRFGDLWDNTMSRMKAAWSQFLTALTNWDWSNFGKRMGDAMDAAAKSQAVHDLGTEVKNSVDIRKAQIREELAELQIIMRDTKRSYAERAKAAQDYLDKVKPIYQQEIDYRNKVKEADLNEYLTNAGIRPKARKRHMLEDFLRDVAPQTDLLEALAEENKRQQNKKNKLTPAQQRLVDEFYAQHKGDYELQATYTRLAAYYQSSNDGTAKKVVDAITAAYAAEAAFNEETRRVQQVKNNAEAQSTIDTSAINTGNTDDSGLKSAEKVLKRAQDSAKSEIQLLYEKYQTEKALLEQYGLDTEALTSEYFRNLNSIIKKNVDETTGELKDIEPVELDLVDVDMSDVDNEVNRLVDEIEEAQRRAEEAINGFANAVANGFADSCDILMESLMGLRDFNGGEVVQALLAPLADLAVQAGSIIMAEGIATLAAKSALETFGATGWGAVAAGAALIAAGAAAKAGLSALAAKASGGATAASSGSSSSSRPQDIKSEMTVYVSGRISGSDIIISGQRTTESWAR